MQNKKLRQVQAEPAASVEKYRDLFEFSSVGFIALDGSGKILEMNSAMATLLGADQDRLANSQFQDHLSRSSIPEFIAFCDSLTRSNAKQTVELQLDGTGPDGKYSTWIQIEGRAIVESAARRFRMAAIDVTRRKQMEEELQKARDDLEKVKERTEELVAANEALKGSEERFRLAVDNLPDAFAIYDRDLRFIFASSSGIEACGRTADELLGHTDEELFPPEAVKSYLPILKKAVETRKTQSGECSVLLPDRTITCTAAYIPLLDESGEIKQILAVTHDITERKRAEERLKASLQEKEVLLKEIHHRVKNNLQIIYSLLSIQVRNIQDETAREAIAECRNRVKSIALVHEKLYRSENLARVDFAQYISGLTASLFNSFGVDRKQIMLNLDLDQVFLSIDRAIPCGLIVNELVSNCLKHAFPGQRPGTIWIELHNLHSNNALLMGVSLVVRDDGAGFSEPLQPQKTKTLGMRLVSDLVKQLKGDLQINNRGGTEVKILFPAGE